MKPETARAIVDKGKGLRIPGSLTGLLSAVPGILILIFRDLFSPLLLASLLVVVSWGLGISLWHNLRFYSEKPLPKDKKKKSRLDFLDEYNAPRLPDLDKNP